MKFFDNVLMDKDYMTIKEVSEYFNISEVLTADKVYKIFSQIEEEKLLKSLNMILVI